MSVIIRLQNLPWSANALDIRQYFRGLSIPEGGVHIVGGEQGDAFIAFSTDEDARQAMMMDGGKIKEVKIRLLLSSRTEMQKVIEQARQQSVSLQTFMQMPAPPMAPLPSVPNLPPMMGQQMSQTHPSMPPAMSQPPLINAPVPVSTAPVVAEVMPVPSVPDRREQEREQKERESDCVSISSNKDKKDRRERSRSRDKDSDRRNKRERDRSRGRRDRDRDRDRNRRHRDRSGSRDRDRNDRNRRRDRRDRSRSRDRSHSRDRNSRDRDRDSKRNSRDRRRDSASLPKEENGKDTEDPVVVDEFPKQQPLLLPHLKMQQQKDAVPFTQMQQQKDAVPFSQMQQQKDAVPFAQMQHQKDAGPFSQMQQQKDAGPFSQMQQQKDAGPFSQMQQQKDAGSFSQMQRAKTPAPTRSMLPATLRGVTPGPPTINASSPSKTLDVGSHERWDLPASGLVMGNIQGSFRPLPALSQGIRPLQPTVDGSHLSEMDNRHFLGGMAFPSDVLRPSLANVGHDIGQTPFIKSEGFRNSDTDNILNRGRENWQGPSSRLQGNTFPRNDRVGGFPNSQDSFAIDEEFDNNKRTDFDYHSPRGNYRGPMRGMGDFRRGFAGRGRGLGPGTGHGMQSRGINPNSHNENDRRGMPSFSPADRRGKQHMFGRLGRNDSNAFSKDRYDNFDRNHSNDRQYSGRGGGFAGERFPADRDRYQNDRSVDHRQQNIVPGMCVEIRNMPSEAGYIDIKRFFNNLYIGSRGIKLINDNHGNRVGIAYVRFFKLEHKEQALMLSGKPMCGSPVEVLPLSDEIFDKAIDSFVPQEDEKEKSNDTLETFVCVAVYDVPVYAKEEDLNTLFRDFGVDEVILTVPPEKKQGVGYVKFNKAEDAKKAVRTLMKPTIGHKVVTITPCSLDQFHNAQKLKQDKPRSGSGDVQERVQPAPKENPVISKAPSDPRQRDTSTETPKPEVVKQPQVITDCILLKGLPDSANDRDILDFFSDIGLVPLRIHIMLDKFNKPTGDAFCEFSTAEEAARATTKNKMPLGKENVIVEALPRTEMHEALGIPLQSQEPLVQHPISHGPRFQQPSAGRNMMNNRPMGLLGASPNAPNRLPLLGRHPHLQPSSQPHDIPVEGFGKPGCVIALENVPFRADVDEILDFFRGFEISRENIIRRFNDKGMPTGDARVSLNSPAEVERAIHLLRFRKIRDRQIFLKPL